MAVDEILAVQPFVLEQGYEFDWSAQESDVRTGTLVVLKADPDLVRPRNAAQPILYAGDRTVQRLNRGAETGVVIGIIPGDVNLATAPIWFGAPGLPESVTEQTIREQRIMAERQEIQPFAADTIENARVEPVRADDLPDLLRTHAAELVLEYAPEERDLVESWRLPVVSTPQRP